MSAISVKQSVAQRSYKTYESCFYESTYETQFTVPRSHRVFHRKKALWEGGDGFIGLYMLRSGSAKSFTLSQEGDEHITKFHFAGELLGLDGFNNAYNYTIEFLETSSVYFFSATEIDLLIKQSTHFRNTLLKSMSDALVCNGAMSLCYSAYTSEQRIAIFLIDLSTKLSQRGQSRMKFVLSMTRTEIANYLGMALETVSRVLGKLQAFDIIDVNQRMVKINNMSALNNCLFDGDCLHMTVVHDNNCNISHA